jgi:ABC-type uncharacterized transport system permease subunit
MVISSDVLAALPRAVGAEVGAMDPIVILHAGLATGTILLFAAIGEIFAERAGILNLGVEG